jgi:hypothetical protein
MKKNLLNFFKKKYIQIAFVLLFTFLATREVYHNIIPKYQHQNKTFNLTEMPDGLVISKIGITETYDSLLLSIPIESRFHKFEVGILNPKTRKVYLVIVPLYAITTFRLGYPVLNGKEESYNKPNQPEFNKPKFNNINL